MRTKYLKEEQNKELSVSNFSIEGFLEHLVSEPNFQNWVKYQKLWEHLEVENMVHPLSRITLCNATLAHQSYYDKLESQLAIVWHHSVSMLIWALIKLGSLFHKLSNSDFSQRTQRLIWQLYS